MNKKMIGIVGAGPAGLTAAYKLSQAGVKVCLFEELDKVGGMAKTIELWGQLVDLGPHRFFSNDPRINELWLEVIGKEYSMVSRLTRIYYKKTFFDYPLKAFNALNGLGVIEALNCIASYFKVKLIPYNNDSNFEGWVSNRFGKRLFEIFFKSYSEKLWGIACEDLDADFAAQRIKKLSLYEAIKSAIFGSGGKKHKTLVDEFAYPHKGAGAVYEKMAKRIMENGGDVFINTPVRSVHPIINGSGKPRLILEDGKEMEFDHIISTMPITSLVERMDAPNKIKNHSSLLRFRNTILVFLEVRGSSPFPDQWIYVHSPEMMTGRITNFMNWVPGINNGKKNTILCLEYWCYDNDMIWEKEDGALVKIAEEDIYKTGLIDSDSVINGAVVKVPKCYPVYETGYRKNLAPVENYLSGMNGVSYIGRYGSFKYNNQDHSILMGLLAAENIVKNAGHDLWAINTDYEYQEASKITSTGLDKDK